MDGLKKMIQSLSDVLNDKSLFWKPSSLRFMTNCDDPLPSFTLHSMEPSRAIVPRKVKQVPHMDVLGARIDAKGSTRVAIAFRLQKALGTPFRKLFFDDGDSNNRRKPSETGAESSETVGNRRRTVGEPSANRRRTVGNRHGTLGPTAETARRTRPPKQILKTATT